MCQSLFCQPASLHNGPWIGLELGTSYLHRYDNQDKFFGSYPKRVGKRGLTRLKFSFPVRRKVI